MLAAERVYSRFCVKCYRAKNKCRGLRLEEQPVNNGSPRRLAWPRVFKAVSGRFFSSVKPGLE